MRYLEVFNIPDESSWQGGCSQLPHGVVDAAGNVRVPGGLPFCLLRNLPYTDRTFNDLGPQKMAGPLSAYTVTAQATCILHIFCCQISQTHTINKGILVNQTHLAVVSLYEPAILMKQPMTATQPSSVFGCKSIITVFDTTMAILNTTMAKL